MELFQKCVMSLKQYQVFVRSEKDTLTFPNVVFTEQLYTNIFSFIAVNVINPKTLFCLWQEMITRDIHVLLTWKTFGR